MCGIEEAGLVQGGILVAAVLFVFALCGGATAAEEPAVVAHIKVVSDKVPDVSSIDAWKASVLKPSMSDKEKAIAIWRTVVQFRHQNAPPQEFFQNDVDSFCVHDPIKTFNVYGYGMCCCAASNIESLARAAGLPVRGRALNGHSLPEIYYDGAWHVFDASLVTYFRNAKGQVASIDEIIENVAQWYKDNPGYKGDHKKLRDFMRNGGWKKGPSILANTDYFDSGGWFPAGTHGWYAPMSEFDGSVNYPYEFGYSNGYEVNVQLREGEVLTRNWSNKGLNVNMDLPAPEYPLTSLDGKIGEGEFKYAADFGDIAPGRVGNGTLVYTVPLAKGALAKSALLFDNLASTADDKQSPALHVKSPGSPAALAIRMPSSYVYLSGIMAATFVVGDGGSVRVSVSRNNGLDWKAVYSKSAAGKYDEKIDLTPFVYRLYDHRLKFEMTGKGTGIDALAIGHDIQHSQRALPTLGPYENKVTFSAGPAEGTVTIEAFARPDTKGNQLGALEFRPVLDGVTLTQRGFEPTSDGGTVTFPVETPGDMTRVRFGCFANTAGETDGWDLLVSFDNGKTWKKAGRVSGAKPGATDYVAFSDIPGGVRKALVRYAGKGKTNIFMFRIDADYALANPGFRPVKITYVWQEGGAEKRDVHVAKSPQETYVMRCSDKPVLKPVMKSVILELAQ